MRDPIVSEALVAVRASNWEQLKRVLHPYLRWTRADGVTLSGRTHVLDWLVSSQAPLEPPIRFEVRDGQIYRWWCA